MTVTLKNTTPLVVPPTIQRRAGLASSDHLEFRATGGVITITAKPPTADDEYTPEQRRVIDARLAKAAQSPVYGPFTAAQIYGPFTAAQTTRFLQSELKARGKKIKKNR